MKTQKAKLACGILLVILGIIVIAASGCGPAKAGRQYRISLYGDGTTPVRTWVTNDYVNNGHEVIMFESMGRHIRVCNNWVVEEL